MFSDLPDWKDAEIESLRKQVEMLEGALVKIKGPYIHSFSAEIASDALTRLNTMRNEGKKE